MLDDTRGSITRDETPETRGSPNDSFRPNTDEIPPFDSGGGRVELADSERKERQRERERDVTRERPHLLRVQTQRIHSADASRFENFQDERLAPRHFSIASRADGINKARRRATPSRAFRARFMQNRIGFPGRDRSV